MRDLVSNIAPRNSLGPAVLSASTNGATVDLQGFDSAAIAFAVGVGGITFDGTNSLSLAVEHSDDGSTWAGVTAADVVLGANAVAPVANGIVRALTAAHAAPSFTVVGYRGTRRFLRARAIFAGTHGTGTPIAGSVILGEPMIAPAS